MSHRLLLLVFCIAVFLNPFIAQSQSSCTDLFGDAPDFMLCQETATFCSFHATTDGGTCDEMCGRFGSQCVAALDNAEGCIAIAGSTDTCQTPQQDEICVCERAETTPPPPSTEVVTGVIPSTGGTLELPNIVTATFPSGTFNGNTEVEIRITSSPETDADFDEFASIFRPINRLSYEVRINTGAIDPASDTIEVVMNIPEAFLNSVPADYGIEVFAQELQTGGEETVDIFEIFPSDVNLNARTIRSTLPTTVFTNNRTADGSYEAVIILAPTPGTNLGAFSNGYLTPQQNGENTCKSSSIICPLTRGCEVTSPFDLARVNPVTNKIEPHRAVDFRAPNGSEVVGVADGVVEESHVSTTFGETIVLRHSNGAATRYAHLQSRSVQTGDPVKRGDIIGLSDNTGQSAGPHLHFEYVPNGIITKSKRRIDPVPCIGSNTNGNITVRDNGRLADDAFEVFLGDVRLGETDIGGSNTLAASNIRSGEYTLRLGVIIAPDNIGTFEITLSDGLTFSDGSTSQIGRLPQSGSISFIVVVP